MMRTLVCFLFLTAGTFLVAGEQVVEYHSLPQDIRCEILKYLVADRVPSITVGARSQMAKTAPLTVADLATISKTFARDMRVVRTDNAYTAELVARVVASLRSFNGESSAKPYLPAETVFDHWLPSDIDSVACRFERKFYSDDQMLAEYARALLGHRGALDALAHEYVTATERLLAPDYEQACTALKQQYDQFGCTEYEIQRTAYPKYQERPYSPKVSEFSYYSCRLMESLAFIGHEGLFGADKQLRLRWYHWYINSKDFQRMYDTRLLLFLTLPPDAQQHETDHVLAEYAARSSRFFTTLTGLIDDIQAKKKLKAASARVSYRND